MSKLYYFSYKKQRYSTQKLWIIDKRQRRHPATSAFPAEHIRKAGTRAGFSGNLFPFWCDEILAGASDQSQEHGIRKNGGSRDGRKY